MKFSHNKPFDTDAISEHINILGLVKATEDAVHIAIAVTNGVEYLVTWNCRHIANAVIRLLNVTMCVIVRL